ncbi:MAG TPA: hypothetical protein ENI23_06575 [bacterium]|nr:hypothetical protein [bacterium]
MIIQLTESHRIKSTDRRNWSVQIYGDNLRDGKGEWVSTFFYGTLRGALQASVDHPAFFLDKKTKKECFEWMDKIDKILKTNP